MGVWTVALHIDILLIKHELYRRELPQCTPLCVQSESYSSMSRYNVLHVLSDQNIASLRYGTAITAIDE